MVSTPYSFIDGDTVCFTTETVEPAYHCTARVEMTSPSPSHSPKSPGLTDKSKRYDRQLR